MLTSESRRKGARNTAPFVRNVMMGEERTRPGHVVGFGALSFL